MPEALQEGQKGMVAVSTKRCVSLKNLDLLAGMRFMKTDEKLMSLQF